MGTSLSPLPPLSPSSPSSSAQTPTSLSIKATSFIPFPRPRPKRKNHLRHKLPIPQTQHPNDLSLPPYDLPSPQILILEESMVVEEMGIDPFPLSTRQWFPWPVIDLSLRFAALIAVQTVATVWLLSGGGGEERGDGGEVEKRGDGGGVETREEKRIGSGEGGDVVDFERMVSEIRVMAREARASETQNVGKMEKSSESKSISRGGVPEKDVVSPPDKLLRGKKDGGESKSRRRIGGVMSKLKNRKAPEGFNRRKGRDERGNCGSGGIQQIAHPNHMEESRKVHKQRESSRLLSETTRKHLDLNTSTDLPVEDSSNVANIHTSTQTANGRIESGSEPSSSEMDKGSSSPDVSRDNQFSTRKESWWLKLPYVLAIFVHRGFDRSAPKGLYSLRSNSPEDDGSYPSYTIAFQDRGDATNFCYIVESFFEDLGEFSADIVPLEIQELEEAIKSGASKVIVVRKGQLRLYAGQPLTEVEAVLRSFFD